MQENNTISLNDLQLVVNIIDICTKRGAFEGSEIFTIGQIREKFVAFVKANMPAVNNEAATSETTTENEVAE